jgi:hypothetical protein
MFYFRINRLKIFDNRTNAFLFFKRDLAQVKIISFVTTSNSDLPNIDTWIATNDPDRKKALLAEAVQSVAASRIITKIDNVKDKSILTFGDTGYVLYQSTAIPADFNWCFIAMEGDDNVRRVGETLNGIVTRPEFDTFASNLATLLIGAANPTFAAGAAVAQFVTSMVAGILKENGDDQIGILYMSLNRREHYFHGERKKDDVPDLTANMLIDYSIFAFEEALQ